MSDRQPVELFFGDDTYPFHLTPDLVLELERKVGTGIGAIYRRFIRQEFGFGDLTETLRLGLIGGGMGPADAATLVNAYAPRLTVTELFLSALPVLDALITGPVQPVAKSPRTKSPAK